MTEAGGKDNGKAERDGTSIVLAVLVVCPTGSAGRTEEVGNVSSSARLVITAVFAVLGVLALIVAVIYFTVPIHSLPSFIPGKHPANGHYHKRGALAAVVGIVLLAIAVVVGLRDRRRVDTPVGSAPDSARVPAPDAATLEESRDAGDAV